MAVRPSRETSASAAVVPGAMPGIVPTSFRSRSMRSVTAGAVALSDAFQTMSTDSPERPANFWTSRSDAALESEPGVP
jgi:hypothetical protein